MESHEERPAAQVRQPPQTWSPELEVDGGPIRMDASLRHFRGGHVGRLADALLQPLLLPSDLAADRSFDYPDLLLSMKRDLAMVSYLSLKDFFLFVHYFLSLKRFFLLHNRSRNKCTWPKNGQSAFATRRGLLTRPETLRRTN